LVALVTAGIINLDKSVAVNVNTAPVPLAPEVGSPEFK
jgi:hypothetical protein